MSRVANPQSIATVIRAAPVMIEIPAAHARSDWSWRPNARATVR